MIPPEAWTVETLRGRTDPEDPLTLSLFAEVPSAGAMAAMAIEGAADAAGGAEGSAANAAAAELLGLGPPAADGIAARAMICLWPDRLSVQLEVANAADEEDASAPNVELGRCGVEGYCSAASSAPQEALESAAAGEVKALADIGLRFEAEGFESVTATVGPSDGTACFQALASEPVTLAPGQMLDGRIVLELAGSPAAG